MLLALLACTPDTGSEAELGSGTIAGSYEGREFSMVGAAYRIGLPDDPDQTMVIYLFDGELACADLGQTAWDETVADQTQSLEMKVIGLSPGTYPLPEGRTPAAGEADANYTLTSTSGTPSEVAATSGSVVIEATDGDGAVGSFDLTFPTDDRLSGAFDAVSCANGHEP